MENFEHELKTILNRYIMENDSDTPDFILATYMMECLHAYNKALQNREKWYRRPVRNPNQFYDM